MTPDEELEAIRDHLSEDGPAIIMNDDAAEIIQSYVQDCMCIGCILFRSFLERSDIKETQH